jgi:hypothetical protein
MDALSQHNEERNGEPDNGMASAQSEPKPRGRKAAGKKTPLRTDLPDELKPKPRKLMIPDPIFRRLEIWACKRQMTYSAVVTDLIKQNAPEIGFTTNKRPSTAESE